MRGCIVARYRTTGEPPNARGWGSGSPATPHGGSRGPPSISERLAGPVGGKGPRSGLVARPLASARDGSPSRPTRLREKKMNGPQHGLAQADRVAVPRVVHPAPDAGRDPGRGHLARSIAGDQAPKLALEMDALSALQATPVGEDREPEERDALSNRSRMRAGVDDEPQPGEPLDERRAPRPQLRLVIAEEQEVSASRRGAVRSPPPSARRADTLRS